MKPGGDEVTCRTILQATVDYLEGRRRRGELSPASASGYRHRLDRFAAAVGLGRDTATLSRRHAVAFLEEIGDLAPASRRAYFVTAKLFCEWLVEHGDIARSPFAGMKPPKEPKAVPRAISNDDVGRVLAVADDRLRVVILCMVHLGLRRGEVARLCAEDVDLVGRVMRVQGKGGHERVLPIPTQLARVLHGWMIAERIHHGPIIRSRSDPSRGLTPATIGHLLTEAMREAGVKRGGWDRVSGHSLRHTAATSMLRHGAASRDVQKVLGHSSLATTERYLPLVVHTLEATVEGRDFDPAA